MPIVPAVSAFLKRYVAGIAICAAALLLESRAFFMGGAVSCACLFFSGHRSVWKRSTVLMLGSVFVLLLPIVFYSKLGSSLGRLFIYKVSIRMFRDNWLWGIGSGNFSKMYLYHQADYFAQGNFHERGLLLADSTH